MWSGGVKRPLGGSRVSSLSHQQVFGDLRADMKVMLVCLVGTLFHWSIALFVSVKLVVAKFIPRVCS